MKCLKYILLYLFLLCMGLGLTSCDEDDSSQPTTLMFTLTSATLDGIAITPNPSYTLSLTFDVDNMPDGYVASGSAPYQPSVGSSGIFSISGNQVTFSSGSDSRTAILTEGSINHEATIFTLEWSLEKTDVAAPSEAGTYAYIMTVQ